jgi:hypothetical protein
LSLALASLILALVPTLMPGTATVRQWLAVLLIVPPICLYMLLGDPAWTGHVQRRWPSGRAAGAMVVGTLLLAGAYLLLAGPLPFVFWRWAVFLLVVAGVSGLWWRGRERPGVLWTDAAPALLVWLAVEFGLLPHLPVPPVGSGATNLVTLLLIPFLIGQALLVRRWTGLGFDLFVRPRMVVTAIAALAAYAAIALPTALLTGFVRPSSSLPSMLEMAGRAIGIWALVALPEEILFRGMIQNGLEKVLPSPALALAIASLIFGAAHLNNPPNVWLYGLLASVAGVAYGWTYQRTGNVVAASLVHLLVDWIWRTFLGGSGAH